MDLLLAYHLVDNSINEAFMEGETAAFLVCLFLRVIPGLAKDKVLAEKDGRTTRLS
jgi:hypothetical protein